AEAEPRGPLEVEAGHVVLLGAHTPPECRRAPCRSRRMLISAEPAASESVNAPGPTASSETERSSCPASEDNASETSRALSATAAPLGSRRYVASAARSPPG